MSKPLDSSIAMHYKTTREFVHSVLEEYPETRANDTLLYARCLQKMGIKTINQLAKNPSRLNMITVHKTRQFIQRDGLCLPSEDVQITRMKNAEEIKQARGAGEI